MSGDLSWYQPGLEESYNRSGLVETLLELLASKTEELQLATRKHCLSIGPATGRIDVPLIEHHLHQLVEYTGVEPNIAMADVLQNAIHTDLTNSGIKCELVRDQVESWSGPQKPVDLILLFDVLYHIPDRKQLFQRCRDWLQPGGVMIITHASENTICYPIAEYFDVKEELYVGKHILEDMSEIGFKNIKRGSFHVPFDISDRQRDVMNFLLQKAATDHEVTDLDEFLKKALPTGMMDCEMWAIWWNKSSEL